MTLREQIILKLLLQVKKDTELCDLIPDDYEAGIDGGQNMLAASLLSEFTNEEIKLAQ